MLMEVRHRSYAAGAVVVAQGETSVEMFFVYKGQLRVTVDGKDVRTIEDGAFFGEVGLIWKVPRTATITAVGDNSRPKCDNVPLWAARAVEVFTLSRSSFESRVSLFPEQRRAIEAFIKKVPLFRSAATGNSAFTEAVVRDLRPRHCDAGDVVVAEGEVGTEMYFCSAGVLEVVDRDGRVLHE
eukprot:gene39494-47943_t